MNGTKIAKKENDKNNHQCRNPLCDHIDFTQEEKANPDHMKEYILRNQSIKQIRNIDDLIVLGKLYHCKKNKEYNGISLRILCNLVGPLTELSNLIGMTSVKESIVNQIIFFLLGFNKKDKCGKCNSCAFNIQCSSSTNFEMLHTIITGPPGVGKTELGKVLGKVYKEMEILSKGHVKIVSRVDLIGQYLGHTATKTQKVIDECSGGVMFIDEAYSLGSKESRDSFAKECIDTLNQNLSERRDFLCIIAGYADALDNNFFNQNEGLKRRFAFRYDIENYNPMELKKIFLLKVKREEWFIECDDTTLDKFFVDNFKFLPYFGGDVESLFMNCKIAHSKRIFCENPEGRRFLNKMDIGNGFSMLISYRRYKEEEAKYELSDSAKMMYM